MSDVKTKEWAVAIQKWSVLDPKALKNSTVEGPPPFEAQGTQKVDPTNAALAKAASSRPSRLLLRMNRTPSETEAQRVRLRAW